MNGKSKKLRKTFRAKRTRKAPFKKAIASTAIKKYVKRAISSNIENKFVRYSSPLIYGAVAGGATIDDNTIQLTPNDTTYSISQGTGDGGRIGNSVNTSYATLKLAFSPTLYDATINPYPNPVIVIGYIYSLKGVNVDLSNAQFAFKTNFFKTSGSSAGISSSIMPDYFATPNMDTIQLHKRIVFKLGLADSLGSTNSVPNNDFKLNYLAKINITPYLPKKIVFQDGATQSVGKQLFFSFSVHNYSVGGTLNVVQLPVRFMYSIDYNYKDA